MKEVERGAGVCEYPPGFTMDHRVLDLAETADYLHIRPEDVEELVRRGEIPFERAGQRLVFRCKTLEVWASRRILGTPPARLGDYHQRSTTRMDDRSRQRALIPELLPAGRIHPALPCRTKPSLLREMVRRAEATGLLVFPEDLRQALEERERQGSTALAGGVALLHPGFNNPYLVEDSFLLLGRTAHPLPFGSPDGRTTDVFFLVCAQDEHLHLHLLARLCMICHHTDALLHLREARTADEMSAALTACEREVLASHAGAVGEPS